MSDVIAEMNVLFFTIPYLGELVIVGVGVMEKKVKTG